ISCVMLTAILGVHWGSGFFINAGGFEYPMALLGMAGGPLIHGGGTASVGSQLGGGEKRRKGGKGKWRRERESRRGGFSVINIFPSPCLFVSLSPTLLVSYTLPTLFV